jgi:probable HAF family extracellular repeat protein
MKNLKLALLTCLTLNFASGAMAQNQHAFIWDSSTGMTDLGTLGGNTSVGLGINDSGQVVGYSYLADNVTVHAFIWSTATGMVDLGTDGGVSSRAWAINATGDVVGDNDNSFNETQTPFYWSPSGGFSLIGRALNYNFAFGINNKSQVTGQIYGQPSVHAFLWAPGMKKPLLISQLAGGTLSVGNAINNHTHITGTADVADGRLVAFLWQKVGGMVQIASVAGDNYTAGEAINDHDQVVGVGIDSTGQYEGFYWNSATGQILLQTLGGQHSAGFGINRSGMFTGEASNASEALHAVVWNNATRVPIDLGTLPGGTNSIGRAVNNLGQVAGASDVP